jgi:pyroglutamyl-peptidase
MTFTVPSILLFSFEPFGPWKTNAGTLIARKVISEHHIARLHHRVLPVCFGRASSKILSEARKIKPDIVLGLGLSGKATCLHLERIAVNINNSTRFDAAGKKPKDLMINRQGPPAYWTTLPYAALLEALKEESIPLRLSFHAGTYVCNDVLFTLLDTLAAEGLPAKVGFLHVPPIKTLKKGKRSLAYLSLALEKILAILQSPSGLS